MTILFTDLNRTIGIQLSQCHWNSDLFRVASGANLNSSLYLTAVIETMAFWRQNSNFPLGTWTIPAERADGTLESP